MHKIDVLDKVQIYLPISSRVIGWKMQENVDVKWYNDWFKETAALCNKEKISKV